jgi:hypothetical protein
MPLPPRTDGRDSKIIAGEQCNVLGFIFMFNSKRAREQ